MTTVDVTAARPEARRRYRHALERFVPFFVEGREYVHGSGAVYRAGNRRGRGQAIRTGLA
jgi:hypothetical protein